MKLDCPNCGGPVDPTAGERYTNCSYCKSSVAVVSLYKVDKIEFKQTSNLTPEQKEQLGNFIKLANRYHEIDDYENAYKCAKKMLEIDSANEDAYLNMALSVYFLNSDNIEKLEMVYKIIKQAESLNGPSDKIFDTSEKLSFNIALKGSSLEQWDQTIKYFRLSQRLAKNNSERDKIVNESIDKMRNKINSYIMSEVKIKKDKYVVNKTTFEMLDSMCDMFDDQDCLGLMHFAIAHCISNLKELPNKAKPYVLSMAKKHIENMPDKVKVWKSGWSGMKEKYIPKNQLIKEMSAG
jgi:tetratricopeptide (TPR) repeat protein